MFQYHIIANLTQFLKGKDVSFVCFETTPIIFLCMMSSIYVKVHTIKEAWNRRHRYVLSKPDRTPLTLTQILVLFTLLGFRIVLPITSFIKIT